MKRCGWFEFEQTKEQFPIRVDSYSGKFEIALGDNYDNKTFLGKDVEKLRSEAFVYLRDLTAGKWERFVIVEYNSDAIQHDHQIYLEYRRAFRLKKSDGTLIWKDWNGPDDGHEGTPGRSSYGPGRDGENRHVKCLPYSKEVWEGLLAITKAIETVDKKIREMVSGADLEAKLRCIAAGTQSALGYDSRKAAK
jgi:hypothetical protein